jgi:hypothetical protein
MLIQYASDLHIDGWPPGTSPSTFITPSAPHLVLAGDICSAWDPRYFQFLKWVSKHWTTVIVIAGNHEYHNTKRHTIKETDAHIQDYCLKRKNLIYLQCGTSYFVPGTFVRIVGSTLWCAPDLNMWKKAAKKKGDYRAIWVDDPAATRGRRKLHPSDVSFLHLINKALLAWAIQPNYAEETIVVATHYLPTKQLLEEEYRGEKWHSFYASDDDDLFESQVALWICGHGHRATRYSSPSGTLVVMNARGYNRQSEQERTVDIYDKSATQKVN